MLRMFVALTAAAVGPVSAETGQVEFFEQRIRPILVEHCYRCHSAEAERPRGGLRLDRFDYILNGGDTGPAIIPGAAGRSLLFQAIAYQNPDLQMPPKSRLSDEVVAHFQRWIDDGAIWPTSTVPVASATTEEFDLAARRNSHWAWQPIRPSIPPRVRNEAWPAGAVDRFILAKLEAAGLRPAAPAEKRALIRRASYLLTGLPPTRAEVAAFAADGSDASFARVVDRLLESPHFGERWARHWLDKMRYAETMGHEFDYPILGAWRYRDYVVRAFNADIPFDQFAREQVAGDLFPNPRTNPDDGGNESLLGTTQYWLGQQVHSPVDVRNHQLEFVDNQMDVITKSFLGLTVSCARCHDHKFDAISTKDYYAFHGILASSRHAIRAVDDPAPRLAQANALAHQRDRLRQLLASRLHQRLASGLPPVEHTAGTLELRADDHEIPLAGWFADGEAFAADPSAAGQPVFLGEAEAPMLSVVPPGWRHGASLSRKFQGALHSPAFVITNDFLHLRLAGQGARVNIVLDGFTLIRAPIYGPLRQAVQNPRPHWITVDVSMWRGRRAWIELADFSVADPASELGPAAAQPDGWIAVGAVLVSTRHEPPPLAPTALLTDAAEIVERWSKAPSSLLPDEASWIEGLLAMPPAILTESELAPYRNFEQGIHEPVLVAAMADADGWDEPVFIRGNHRTTGETVPRRFLEALSSIDLHPIQQGSGRRELAEAIVHPDNPLFARVTVNWVWAQLFGRGLVSSVDNFGALGDAPSHPELLDWLATSFRQSGWSTKQLIRQLVLSRTWQMSSAAAHPETKQLDPDNVLWHRANLRRLDGESLRDAMLAISGRLDPTLGGPPVPIHLTPFMDGRGRPALSGPLDGDGRRSLYLEVRRNFLAPLMLAFDTPVPASTVGHRTVSNVPAQALILMNDPFVAEQAKLWSIRLRQEVPRPPAHRISRLYLEAFARQPLPNELSAAKDFLAAQLARTSGDEAAAWADLCHALFNLKEFLFLD
jgi:hypothetical protein